MSNRAFCRAVAKSLKSCRPSDAAVLIGALLQSHSLPEDARVNLVRAKDVLQELSTLLAPGNGHSAEEPTKEPDAATAAPDSSQKKKKKKKDKTDLVKTAALEQTQGSQHHVHAATPHATPKHKPASAKKEKASARGSKRKHEQEDQEPGQSEQKKKKRKKEPTE